MKIIVQKEESWTASISVSVEDGWSRLKEREENRIQKDQPVDKHSYGHTFPGHNRKPMKNCPIITQQFFVTPLSSSPLCRGFSLQSALE